MTTRITRFTNGLLSIGGQLSEGDLYVDTLTGKIILYRDAHSLSAVTDVQTVDLSGRILAPGFIDVQLNGHLGMDFSTPGPDYVTDLRRVKKHLLQTGVTSFLPTISSQSPEVYEHTLPHLGADQDRNPEDGAESLGAHCEGPFINPAKCGIHKSEVLQTAGDINTLETCYGREHLRKAVIKMITMAPELDISKTMISELSRRGIVVSMGHSAATYEQAIEAVDQGSTMITHLYNAMSQTHHRDPGIVGLLGSSDIERPWYSMIADGLHMHPAMATLAYNAYPEGCCLITDAQSVTGLCDGRYAWTNGEYFIKKGESVLLERTGGLAGSAVTLLSCLNNLISWTGVSTSTALRTVTSNPASMLGLEGIKGTLSLGGDADLVILSHHNQKLVVDEVWKFGVLVYSRQANESSANNPSIDAG